MSTLLLTNHYEGTPLEILRSVLPSNINLLVLEKAEKNELIEKAKFANYFLVSGRLHIDKDVLDSAVNLKMIQRTGVGLDVFDFDEIKNKGVPLYVNQGVNSQSVAEHTVLLILACLKKLTLINSNVKNGIWKKQLQGLTTFELCGKTVGLVGIGNIGKKVANILNAFGAKVVYHDMFRLDVQSERNLNVEYMPLEELLSVSDIVSLHCPLTEDTKYLINASSIDIMKTGSVLVNTSRGPLICENDLINALISGKISFAGLDVYEEEPTKNDRLLSLDNVITTPHIGGVSYDSFRRMMELGIRNIVLFDQGKFNEIEQFRYKY